MSTNASRPIRPILVARRVAAVQTVSLLGFAAVAVAYAVRARSAPEATGSGDFSEIAVLIPATVAALSTVAATAIGVTAGLLARPRPSARIALIVAEYTAAAPVALMLLSNLHARGQAPLQLLGTGYLGLTAAALIALQHSTARSWVLAARLN